MKINNQNKMHWIFHCYDYSPSLDMWLRVDKWSDYVFRIEYHSNLTTLKEIHLCDSEKCIFRFNIYHLIIIFTLPEQCSNLASVQSKKSLKIKCLPLSGVLSTGKMAKNKQKGKKPKSVFQVANKHLKNKHKAKPVTTTLKHVSSRSLSSHVL